jgi:hypothetical protein
MSAESTQRRHQTDQENTPKTEPSLAQIVRAFGVVLGPALLLDLFAALSTLAVLTGRASRPRGRLARLLRTLAIPGSAFP